MRDYTNKEFEIIFDPIDDLRDRWELTEYEAESFLENVGYFDGHNL